MGHKLSKPEKQRLRKHFGDELQHPLLMVCDEVFSARAARLQGVKADGEDVFREVARLLDQLMEATQGKLAQTDINAYYTKLVNDVREWEQSTPADREIIADTVFRIVRKMMCHYCGIWQSENIYAMMGKTLERESRKADKEEEEEFEDTLFRFSEQLDNWINREYDGLLSKAIEEVERGKILPIKQKSGRKAIDPNNITESFNYLPKVSQRLQRLQAFFDGLEETFIKADSKDFIDLFTGKTTTKKILWVREIIELKYLMHQLAERKWITWPTSYGKWQMVCARFKIRRKEFKKTDDRLTNDSYYVEDDLKESQFNNSKKVPKKHEELDRLLRVLNPETDYRQALDDYLDYKEMMGEHSEIEDTADALAHGLNTDIHL